MRDLCFASRIGASMVVGVGVHLSFLLVWYYTLHMEFGSTF